VGSHCPSRERQYDSINTVIHHSRMARTSQPWGSLLLGATNVFQTSTLDLNHWYARLWLPNSRNNSNREMGFLIRPLRDLGTQPIGHVAGYSTRVNDCRMTTVSRFCRAAGPRLASSNSRLDWSHQCPEEMHTNTQALQVVFSPPGMSPCHSRCITSCRDTCSFMKDHS